MSMKSIPLEPHFYIVKLGFTGDIPIFVILLQNIDCGCSNEAVLTSTHNLCFGAKIRKIVLPLHTPVLLCESVVSGVFITRTCFPDVSQTCRNTPKIEAVIVVYPIQLCHSSPLTGSCFKNRNVDTFISKTHFEKCFRNL